MKRILLLAQLTAIAALLVTTSVWAAWAGGACRSEEGHHCYSRSLWEGETPVVIDGVGARITTDRATTRGPWWSVITNEMWVVWYPAVTGGPTKWIETGR